MPRLAKVVNVLAIRQVKPGGSGTKLQTQGRRADYTAF